MFKFRSFPQCETKFHTHINILMMMMMNKNRSQSSRSLRKVRTVLHRLNSEIVISNSGLGTDLCPRFTVLCCRV